MELSSCAHLPRRERRNFTRKCGVARLPLGVQSLPAYRKTMTIEKFAFPSASDIQCRDRRRLDPSMRIVPGTDCAALRNTTKSPQPAPGAHAQTAGFRLPAGLEAGSATSAGGLAANDVTGGDQL